MQTKYTLVTVGKSPRWYVQWAVGGRSHRRSTGSSNREEAEAFLAAFKLAADAAPGTDMSVSDAIDYYRDNKKVVSKATADFISKRLKAFYGSTPILSAGPASQKLYIDERRKNGVKDETIRRELSVLSAAFRYTAKYKELERVPSVIALPASPPKERWLTKPEAAILFRHLRTGWTPPPRGARRRKPAKPNYPPGPIPPDRGRNRTRHLLLFCRLAIFTAARTTAILELTWDRVDLKRRTIDYNVPGREITNKRRVVARIGLAEVRMLKAAKKRAQSEYVIEWHAAKVDRVARALRNHLDILGYRDVSAHTMRHTFATWAARGGSDMHSIGGALGQSVTATTERYAKHHPDTMREVFASVRKK